MIKINLAVQKKRPPINIQFGWLFVGGYALVTCICLYMVNSHREEAIAVKRQEEADVKAELVKVQPYTTARNNAKKQLDQMQRNATEYARMTTPSTTVAWTNTMLMLENIITQAKTVWIRDLHIEGDGRVTMSGTSKENDHKRVVYGVTRLVENFKTYETSFRPPHLRRINWEGFRDQTVATFELSTALTRY